MSVCSVIVMGAKGRMGSTIAGLVQKDPEARLAAVLEKPEHASGLSQYDCLKGFSLKDILPQTPGSVIIDFTSPETSLNDARLAAESGNPIVIGTTGLKPEQQAELESLAKRTRVFWAPNMSVGVNVLLKVLPQLVKMLGPDYDLEMSEIHHRHKADAPSGTALKIAQCLAGARDWNYDEVKRHCRDGIIGPRGKNEIGVQTLRGGDVVGDHTVYMLGPGERIEITHRAHSRETFAQGAIRAAKWIVNQKPGRLYSMHDVF